jgi:thiosulfate dehydrogenase (quinone) large subunit
LSPAGPQPLSSGEAGRVLYALAGLRILLGVLWLANLSWKLPPDFGKNDPEGLLYNFRRAEHYAVIGPLRDVAREVLIPHFTLFGWLVFLAELAAGVLLLLGLWTRVGALIGLVQSIAITLLVVDAPNEWVWTYVMFIAIGIVVLVTPSGRRLSLDARRRRG